MLTRKAEVDIVSLIASEPVTNEVSALFHFPPTFKNFFFFSVVLRVIMAECVMLRCKV